MVEPRVGRLLRLLTLVGFGAVLAGCAQPSGTVQDVTLTEAEKNRRQLEQQKLALELRNDARLRLSRVAHPLLRAGVPWCNSGSRPGFGWRLGSLHSYREPWRVAARDQLGVHRRPTVLALVPDGPADRAGLRPGDVLVRVGGETLPTHTPSDGDQPTSVLHRAQNRLERGTGTRTLTVKRNGTPRTVSVQPVTTCDYRVRIESGGIRRFPGKSPVLSVPRDLVTFTRDHDELSVVVAHLIAHRMMNHSDKRFRNWVSGVTVDLLAFSQGIPTLGTFGYLGNNRHTGSFEAEADYLAIYLAARAGFSTDRADIVWKRLAAARPSSIGTDLINESYYTSMIDPPAFLEEHPLTTKRFQVMEAAMQRIVRQREKGTPLTPTNDIRRRLAAGRILDPAKATPSPVEGQKTNKRREPDTRELPEPAVHSRGELDGRTPPDAPGPRLTRSTPQPLPASPGRGSPNTLSKPDAPPSNDPPGDTAQPNPAARGQEDKRVNPGGERAGTAPKKPSNEAVRRGQRPETESSRAYTIQVGSYLQSSPAQKLRQVLREDDHPARIHRTTVHGTPYFRVVVGGYPSRERARKVARELVSSNDRVSSFWVRPRSNPTRDQTVLRREP